MFNYQNETYFIFLTKKYFKKGIFGSIYWTIKKNLENKGITTVCIDEFIQWAKQNEINKQSGQMELSFDGQPYPNINVLYIHLFNGQYYNDSIYNKKKT